MMIEILGNVGAVLAIAILLSPIFAGLMALPDIMYGSKYSHSKRKRIGNGNKGSGI